MDLSDLLEPERIRCQCEIQSKKRTLQTLAELLGESLRAKSASDAEALADNDTNESKSGTRKVRLSRKQSSKNEGEPETLSDMQILDALISRERLGSTGLGHGVALPHSRLSNIQEPIAALVTLNQGVDYESADGQPVDLVLGLLVPEHCNDEHLKILAQLARRFSDEALRTSLRGFVEPNNLYAHLASLPPTTD
ncbi:PTS sugar transporter subunit IIA [Granulosicoccus antarcticus]|uniref:Nitrogen regulatory protein n=1 Tax=Granulosicoccus antarcticus IMCC3135 TaxID=1192854 RepID=A0A2Z2NZR1_9GAMM|nr:PTS sugar transporter subunit IIA [Granulosicoccus antarcticus]ASJ75925.1 Nitrogen regulatory protein [Granulosicoccus antarcticus IMCC3135]